MRTPFLRKFLGEISELNNYYHNFSFLWEQFKLDNLKSKENKGVTSVIYKDNPESRRYNIEIKKLEKASFQTKIFVLKSLYVQTYSIFETFLKEIYYFCKYCKTNLPEITSSDNSLNQVLQNLDLENCLNDNELATLKYLRLRRNRLIHSEGSSLGEILTIINNKGKKLDNYWTTILKKKSLYELDFSKKDLLLTEHKEYIDIFTIFRVLAEKIEQIILTTYLNDAERKKATVLYVKKNSLNSKIKISEDRLNIKIIKICLHEFAIKLVKDDLNHI